MNLNRLARVKTRASLKRMLDRYYGGSPKVFINELNKESVRLIRTDLKKARLLTLRTAGLERILPEPQRAHLYRIWGRHCHLSSEYSEARKLYEKALALFTKLRDQDSSARVRKALLDVMMYLGKYDIAVKTGKQALRYFKRIGSDLDYAQVLTNLGNLYHRLDQNLKALKYYDPAYEIFKKLKNDYAVALVQFNRGNVYSNLNNQGEAERLYVQAASIYRSLGMDLAAGQADYSLAYIAYLKGAYSESLGLFSRAADEFRRLGDRRMLALTELDTSEINLHLNLYSQVIEDTSVVAGEFRQLKMSYERAKAYYFAAAAYYAFADFTRATRLANQAGTLFKQENNHVWLNLCRFLLARIDSQEGRHQRAIKAFRDIANFHKRRGGYRHYYDSRLALLDSLIVSKDYKAASATIRQLDRALNQMAGYQKFIYFMLLGDMNRNKLKEGPATAYYCRAVRQAEKLQAAIFPDEMRRSFWMDKLVAYNRLVSMYLKAGKEQRAFEVLEKGRAAILASSRRSPDNINGHKIPPKMEEERSRLKSYLHKALIPVGTGVRGAAAATDIRYAEHRLWKIGRTLRDRNIRKAQFEVGKSGGVESVQKKLRKSEMLLQYVCREDACGIFIVTRDKLEFKALKTDRDVIRGLLARLYFMVNRVGSNKGDHAIISGLLQNLSEILRPPPGPEAEECKRLYIIPDGFLARMPMYLLRDDTGVELFEKCDIFIFSSSQAFLDYDHQSKIGRLFKKASLLAVSDTELPGSLPESIAISHHLPQLHLFKGSMATSRNLYASMEKVGGLVHLIAHAAQSYENHLFSRILLADGPLYPFDLMKRPVNAGLVVLSGCQTGDPGLYYRSDNLSLAQAFLMAGARQVIASYWPIADEVTCRFMDAFYKHLMKEVEIYPALRKAMIEMKSHTGDIRYYAPFYLTCG
jgi:tetratricopeptide (TPR) repeat protein